MSAGAPASPARVRRARPARARLLARSLVLLAVAGAGVALAAGLLFAGSGTTLAEGTRIAGVEVGGLTPSEATRLLERRAAALEDVPVTFLAAGRRWRLTPAQLGVKADWASAVAAAERQGEGFAPVRGLRRLHTRFFGADIAPPARVFAGGLDYALDRVGRAVARSPREAAIVLRGLRPAVVPGRTGRALERRAAEDTVVRALSSFARRPVALPVRRAMPAVTAAELRPVLGQVRTALAKPVRLRFGSTRWRIPRWRIAELLALPRNGRRELAIGGPAADRWFARLGRAVNRPARDAEFVARADGAVAVVPARTGEVVSVSATAAALLAAVLSPTDRSARVVVRADRPQLTTAEARSLGVTRVLAAFSTPYAGTADRIHNLQLAVSLLDGARVAPGRTFTFNGRVGERTEERGFRSAPVIVGGEYEEGIGGGVSQVATTVFNAAWEAGLRITQRAPHALYISRYPLGRDATVNFPDLDLRFLNDTERWLVLRAWSSASGITVSILGAPTGRRVESDAGEVRVLGPVPVKEVPDPSLAVGTRIVEEEGAPPTSVTVHRTIYEADGTVRARETWTTNYIGEKQVVRVGTKAPPRPEPPPVPPTADGAAKKPKASTSRTTPEPAATTPATPEPPASRPPLP